MRSFLIAALLGILPSSLAAQRFSPAHVQGSFPRFHHPGRFGGSRSAVAFFYPLDSDYVAPDYPVITQPPVIVMQPPVAQAAAEPVPPAAQPLLIELRGDRYVQVGADIPAPQQAMDAEASTASGPILHRPSSRREALLIFRDGHRENVASYTIADGFLYASSDYYTSGSWSRRIELSALDLPESVRANQSRGLNFQLPTAPNEVIVGP